LRQDGEDRALLHAFLVGQITLTTPELDKIFTDFNKYMDRVQQLNEQMLRELEKQKKQNKNGGNGEGAL
jgi:hypothetical protein